MLYAAFGTGAPVGGIFACPGCLTGVTGFNPYVGTMGPIGPYPGFGPMGKIPGYNPYFGAPGGIAPFGPITGYNPYIAGYPGICTSCV